MKSIRTFLLTRLLGGTTCVLVAAGIGGYFVVAGSLEDHFDRNLSDRVAGLASLIFQPGEDVEFEFSGQLMPEYGREELPAYFELWFRDGRVLERSESLHGRDLSVPEEIGPSAVHWSAPLPDGRPGRYVARLAEVHHVYPEEGPDRPVAARIRIVIAHGREALVAAERAVMLQIAAVCVVLILLIAFLTWRAVQRGLEPANRLAAAVGAIRVHDLPERLDAGELPLELRPVAEKTDALIRRVDTALSRERRTSADIAHELRTPISEVLTVSEVALRDGRDPEATRKALSTVRVVAWRMACSVSTLLKLARIEMGAEAFERGPVDLSSIVQDVVRTLAALCKQREVRVDDFIGEGEQVESDRDVLRIVISNVLTNACTYSPRGSTVVCSLERSDDRWRLIVTNEAVDLLPDDLRSLSEPFWRKDRSRTDRNRSGLGLALSRALAETMGLELEFALESRTFRATLGGRGETSTPAFLASSTSKNGSG